jgi:tRNA (cytidine/uridine-2'-O-)-methyltransferase
MFEIVLYQPEIPPNTGNIIRLAANTGCRLHLIEPLGFDLDDRQLRRAGLDYHEYANLSVHADWASARAILAGHRLFAMTTKGSARHDSIAYRPGDAFLFGPESRGLPVEILDEFTPEHRLRLPMLPRSRSLNLANSAAVVVYEAWRQAGFEGGV